MAAITAGFLPLSISGIESKAAKTSYMSHDKTSQSGAGGGVRPTVPGLQTRGRKRQTEALLLLQAPNIEEGNDIMLNLFKRRKLQKR